MDAGKYTADDIAGWFIDFNKKFVDTEDAELISPMKLQKLLYYAQGAFIAIDGAPLFDDDIEVWDHGTVVPSVYRKYKKYGAGGIDENESGGKAVFDEHTRAMLQGVYEKYGMYSASRLRNMTHSEPPYIKAAEAGDNAVISKESMKEYFAGTVYKKWLDDTLFDDIPVEEIA
jgi:uncharacterized phage-associated protein